MDSEKILHVLPTVSRRSVGGWNSKRYVDRILLIAHSNLLLELIVTLLNAMFL